ncbi:MAG: hypothetical protein IJJ13_03195, partial [Lachnospiraceae bacterium]|nr:hypothetical protein [Lachnospiraceae bacterium]
VKDHLHDFMGKVFEKMAKEYLMSHAGTDDFPILTDITDYQDAVLDEERKQKQIEIDLLGKNGKQILLAGECKFKTSQFDRSEYEKLLDKIKYLPATNPVVCVFSLGGFSEYVQENAMDCKMITLDEMYE